MNLVELWFAKRYEAIVQIYVLELSYQLFQIDTRYELLVFISWNITEIAVLNSGSELSGICFSELILFLSSIMVIQMLDIREIE